MKKGLVKKLLMKTIREHLSSNDRFNGRKPSVEELEKILDEEGQGKICLNPDGSIGTKEIKTSETLADAILSVFKLALKLNPPQAERRKDENL